MFKVQCSNPTTPRLHTSPRLRVTGRVTGRGTGFKFAVAFFVCGVCASGTGGAATKCVNLDTSLYCAAAGEGAPCANGGDYGALGKVNWCWSCKVPGTFTYILDVYGVAVCSNQPGDSKGAVSDNITLGNDNAYCWYRMITPAVSKWVFYKSYSSAATCAQHCGFDANMKSDGSVKPALFSSVNG